MLGFSRSIAAIFLLSALLLQQANAGNSNPTSADFHVAIDGKDSNSGSATSPFATIARAQLAVRKRIEAGLSKPIVVHIHEGRYFISETLIFSPEDSGSKDFSVTYAASPGEKVVIDGGRRISGWQRDASGLWTATLPEVKAGKWYPRQLFINGQRAIRARTPNQGWCEGKPVKPIEYEDIDGPLEIHINTTGGKGIFGHAREFEYDQAMLDGGIVAWNNPGDIELVSLRHNEGGRKAVSAINPHAQTITLQPPHRWAPKCYGNDWFNGVPDGRCYLENALEFLDSPGEWYVDRSTGLLSYLPRESEDLSHCDVIAPVVRQTLLSISGSKQKPIVNLHFHGLHLEHVDWQLPEQGYGGLFCSNVPIFREHGDPGHEFIDAAVEMVHSQYCSFCDGGIAGVGAMGLVLGEGTANITIEGNHIQQTGAGGIGLGQCNVGFGYLKAAPAAEPGEYEQFRICNNHVHDCGLDYFGAVGIALFRMKDSTIAHNLIHDTAYCGVVFPGDQDPSWNFVGGNVFERNHIYHDMHVTQDGAGLYASFTHRGTMIRANLIHSSSGNPMSGGICLDGCTGMTFDHNVVYGNPVWSLVLFRPVDLAENNWIGNLVMPARAPGTSASRSKTLFDGRSGWELQPGKQDFLPPAEFIEAMEQYAGLRPAYRQRLQGTIGHECELHILEDGLTWQLNFPEQKRGVIYRIDAQAGKAVGASLKRANAPGVKLLNLDPSISYQLSAYAGPIRPNPTDSSVGDFTSGPLFPMVYHIEPVAAPNTPQTVTGRELMENGMFISDKTSALWVAYQKSP